MSCWLWHQVTSIQNWPLHISQSNLATHPWQGAEGDFSAPKPYRRQWSGAGVPNDSISGGVFVSRGERQSVRWDFLLDQVIYIYGILVQAEQECGAGTIITVNLSYINACFFFLWLWCSWNQNWLPVPDDCDHQYSGQINVKKGMSLPLNGNVLVWWIPLTLEFSRVETSQPRFNVHLLYHSRGLGMV